MQRQCRRAALTDGKRTFWQKSSRSPIPLSGQPQRTAGLLPGVQPIFTVKVIFLNIDSHA